MNSLGEEVGEDDVVDDEIWENQRREGSSGMWLPAYDRGRFSDRFGRFKYNQLSDVPIPKNSRVVEDFVVASTWNYAKNFATLESDLAKGSQRNVKWNYSVRWRRWSRKRASSRESNHEIMSGWLGSKERRGTWKSRYFMLMGGLTGGAATPNLVISGTCGEESEDDSSNDEGDADDVEVDDKQPQQNKDDEDTIVNIGSPIQTQTNSLQHTVVKHLSADMNTTPSKSDPEYQPPVLFYLRRGFTDPRAAFPLTFDLAELRRLPKRQIRTLKLPNRVKIDDALSTSETPGRFAIKYPSGRKRVLNAASAELRERWVDALRSLIEDNADMSASPTSKRHGRLVAAFRAAKRGQQELRKGFVTLRRSSIGAHHHHSQSQTTLVSSPFSPNLLPSPSLSSSFPPPSLQVDHSILQLYPRSLATPMSPSPSNTITVELMRSEFSGVLNLRLAELELGKGLFVESIFENAKDSHGNFPSSISVGDNVIGVQGESLLGLDKGTVLHRLKEILNKISKTDIVVLTVIPITNRLVKKKPSSEYHPTSPLQTPLRTSNNNRSPMTFGLETDESERDDTESFKTSIGEVKATAANSSGNSSDGLFSQNNNNQPIISSAVVNTVTTSFQNNPTYRSNRTKIVDVPTNSLGITSSHARTITLKCLEKLIKNGPITYGQLRNEVAMALHAENGGLETDDWRHWFRDFLDFWVCDGIKYTVGGLDLNDFTPVIFKVEDA